MMHKKLSLLLGLLVFSIFFSQQGRKEQLQKQNSELKNKLLPLMLLLQKPEEKQNYLLLTLMMSIKKLRSEKEFIITLRKRKDS